MGVTPIYGRRYMKIIAHRGGMLGQENTLEAFRTAARMGADLVECDVRRTSDGVLVIYHDENLTRLAGAPATVSDTTFARMQALLEKQGRSLLTFRQLAEGYREKAPVLLHVKLGQYDDEFARTVVNSGLDVVPGVGSIPMLQSFTPYLPPEKILAFLPNPEKAKDFHEAGCGILRLWEYWLPQVTPKQVKEVCLDAQVFIMACSLEDVSGGIPVHTMDGSEESLDKCLALGADGVLLNDLEMAIKWREKRGC